MTGCVDGPFGILPLYEREISVVYWSSERRLASAVAGTAAPATSNARAMEVLTFTLLTSARAARTLIPTSGDGRFLRPGTRPLDAPPRRSRDGRSPRSDRRGRA